MTKEELHLLWTENLQALCIQIELNKKMIQTEIGKSEYKRLNLEKEIEVLTLNYIFLLASWFDCSINILMNENSKEGFLGIELEKINDDKLSVYEKWRRSFNISICRKYNLNYTTKKSDYSDLIVDTDKKAKYKKTLKLMENIKDILEIRNKIAHGQWKYAVNRKKTNKVTIIEDFLKKYDNIQKLDILFGIYSDIYNLIKNAVISLKTFERDFDKILNKIDLAETRIENSDYEKYKRKFYEKEKMTNEAKIEYKKITD